MKGMGCGSVSCPPRGPRRAGATGFRRTRRDWSEGFPNWLTEQPVNTAGQPVNRKKQLFVHFKIKINAKITKSYNFKSNSFCPAQTFIDPEAFPVFVRLQDTMNNNCNHYQDVHDLVLHTIADSLIRVRNVQITQKLLVST
jgi:hypothetical protein